MNTLLKDRQVDMMVGEEHPTGLEAGKEEQKEIVAKHLLSDIALCKR